jgi:hypothetical protein
MRLSSLLIACLLCGSVLGAARLARAQAVDTESARAQARQHFQRGMEFFDEGRFDAALAEFQRANETSPSAEALYNLGRVHAALGDAVSATRVFQLYLAQAGAVRETRRQEVQERLARQRARIASVWVRASDSQGAAVPATIVSLDGVDLPAPEADAPFLVSAGSHSLGVRAPGYDQVHLALTVAGGDERHVQADLHRITRARGTLRVRSSLPAVEVRVDGQAVGRTPLLSTIPVDAGVHHLSAHRPGYQDEEREVTVLENAAVEVQLELRRSPSPRPEDLGQLRLRLPAAPHLVRLDGEPIDLEGGGVELPIGPHHLRIEVSDREPQEQMIEVPPRTTVDLTIHLVWTPDAQAERRRVAHRRRVGGRLAPGLGAGLLGAGFGVFGWNQGEIHKTDRAVRQLNEMCRARPLPAACADGTSEARGRALSADQDRQNVLRAVSLSVAGLGLVSTVIGLSLWLSSPSDDEINAAASARLELGPSGARFRLTF